MEVCKLARTTFDDGSSGVILKEPRIILYSTRIRLPTAYSNAEYRVTLCFPTSQIQVQSCKESIEQKLLVAVQDSWIELMNYHRGAFLIYHTFKTIVLA